jgi:hypothetical protein
VHLGRRRGRRFDRHVAVDAAHLDARARPQLEALAYLVAAGAFRGRLMTAREVAPGEPGRRDQEDGEKYSAFHYSVLLRVMSARPGRRFPDSFT